MPGRATHLGFVAAALLATAAEAQIIRGRVIQDVTDAPVVAADVMLLSTDHNVLARTPTDSLGWFMLRIANGGRYRLRAESIGHKGATTAEFDVGYGDQLEVRIVLSPTVVLLAPLEITARSRPLLSGMTMQGYNERREKGLGYAITREDIDQRHARAVTDLLRMVPGVRVEWDFGGSTVSIPSAANQIYGGCRVKVYLDGLEFVWGASTIDDIPTYDIEAIEVFKTLADLPPELAGSDARCGVIAVWTRRGKD